MAAMLGLNKTLGEKIDGNYTNCFEQMQEASLNKTAALQVLVSHLKTHLSMTNMTCGALLGK